MLLSQVLYMSRDFSTTTLNAVISPGNTTELRPAAPLLLVVLALALDDAAEAVPLPAEVPEAEVLLAVESEPEADEEAALDIRLGLVALVLTIGTPG